MNKNLAYLQDSFNEAKRENRLSQREAREMLEYYRGNQLPDDVIAVLNDRGQPIQWENVIAEIDTSLDGMKSQTKAQIEITPRNQADSFRAEILEKIHHTTIDSTEWFSEKNRCDVDLRLAGLGCMEVAINVIDELDNFGKPIKELRYTHIPVLEAFIDMYSRKTDYSDARYFHQSRLYDKDSIVALFGEKAKSLTPNKNNMIRLQKSWFRIKGQIRIALWGDGQVLEDLPQPYTHTDNRFSVIVRRIKYSHIKEFYGLYRSVKPFQDKINHMTLRMINMIGSSKLLIEADAVEDVDEFQQSYSMDNSVTVVNNGVLSDKRIQDIKLTNDIAQVMNIIQDARRKALQIIGVNPELLGTSTARQSGVALENKQNAGLVGLQRYMSSSFEMDKDLFEIASSIIGEHFNAEQVFHITKNNIKEAFYINQYVRNKDGTIIYDENHIPKQKNILSVGRYDFIINQVPYNNGSSDAKMKSWAEIMKILPPEVSQALIPSMLRDVGSPQAQETQKILEELQQKKEAQPPQAPPPQEPKIS